MEDQELRTAEKQDLVDLAAEKREAIAARVARIRELEAQIAALKAENDEEEQDLGAIYGELWRRS